MEREGISPKQEEILEYIKSEVRKHGYPPSVRDICDAVHLRSTSSVHAHLSILQRKGYIRRDSTKPRAIEITDNDYRHDYPDSTNVPLVGTVAAGQPILAAENIEGYYPVPTEILPNRQCFLLTVKGESMTKIGILDGDYLLVEQTNEASDNDIIVALVDDSATVKRFFRKENEILLVPENDSMEPISVTPDRYFRILGKAIAAMRVFR